VKILLIDNYDSFTYNLYHLLASASGREPRVLTHDAVDPAAIARSGFTHIVISPGPGRPENARDFGACARILAETELPLLGVCLGFQGLVQVAGGRVIPAPEPIHGRHSDILHWGDPLFHGVPHRFAAIRYHSLTVAEPLPDCLMPIARTAEGLLMGVRHRERPQVGLQFHPESIGTRQGQRLIANFLGLGKVARSRVFPGNALPGPARGARPLVPHWRKLDGSFDPERVFCGLYSDQPRAFWLDSSLAGPGSGRFSYMGCDDGPHAFHLTYRSATAELILERGGERTRPARDIWSFLGRTLAHHGCEGHELPFDFAGGFVGYFGYELKAECGGAAAHRSPHADAAFLFVDRFLAFDQAEGALFLVALSEGGEAGATDWFERTETALAHLPPLAPPLDQVVAWHLARPRETYLADIRTCLAAIGAGESYEVCLTNQLKAAPVRAPLDLYRRLRHINPAPYAAWLRFDELAVMCSSPERFLRLDRERRLTSKPIKGTRARGARPEEDEAIRGELAASLKDRSENLMIVDLVRNDLGRVCEIGSSAVPRLMEVESFATLHQLVSTVSGRLRTDRSALDAVRAAFPGGSMTGAPKRRTMEIIDGLEGQARGIYSGSLGFLSLNGTAELNIVIRTIVADGKALTAGIGGAVVALSDPETEFDEIMVKAAALIRATEETSLARGATGVT